jgi:phosphoglycolate phosphatase
MPELIIFDLDGTLLDTIEDLAESVNHALKQYHFPTHPLESYRYFVGNGVNKLLERALPEGKRSSDFVSMLKVEFIKHYFAHADKYTRPYPGVSELLASVQAKGIKLGIASNKVHEATVQLSKGFFPDINFIAVIGQREGFAVKPNPAILEEIIEIAGIKKENTLYVGDSGVDVATANNAKVPFVGVLWGFRPRKELEEVGASRFVETVEELTDLIHSL